jgi:hypothetical protein
MYILIALVIFVAVGYIAQRRTVWATINLAEAKLYEVY